MQGIELLPAEIEKALDRGATVVTGNQRAARTLRRAFDRRNRSLGLASWSPANVIAWDTWTANLWRRLLIDGHAGQLLLNRSQEHAIWRQILNADPELRSLRSKDALAEMASDAWRRLCAWNGQDRLRGTAASSDTRAFQRWAIEFQRRCRDGGFLPQAEQEKSLSTAAESGQLHLETNEVALVGFDRMTPAQIALTGALRNMGYVVNDLRLSMPTEDRLLVRAPDDFEEISMAARWIRRFLEEHHGARVGVIVPALEKQRAEIDRVFREVLAPELQNIMAPETAGPFEFSLGVPLAQTQMAIAALDLLRWAVGPLPLDRVSALILSPYFAMSDGERGVRGEFDAFELRKALRLRPEVSLDWLSRAVDQSSRKSKLGRLPGALRAMRRTADALNKSERRSHTDWAETMREILHAAQWGFAAETSVEFQARNKWESALDEMATLDFDGSRTQLSGALDSLERIARQTMFAPESRDAPVQIMGALEAAGSTFNAVWFLRAGDLHWPAAEPTTPLLPWHLQRDLGMPGTSVASDSEHSRRTTERIAASAPNAIFSFAIESAEGAQRPSPAVSRLALNQADTRTFADVDSDHPIVQLETIEDTARVQTPDQIIRGGAQVLRLQAACGFRAFAEQRLWSTEPEPAITGMDARQNGIVVHRVLELFWSEVKTQRDLKQMPLVERASLVERCITQALEKIAALSATPWEAAYMQMQRIRLRTLLSQWLDLELTRPPFEVKLSEKEFNDAQIGPLHLRVRIDRIDQVEGGDLLIDYKTGDAKPNAWLSDRPDEPQLPLYAILSNPDQLQGVAFGLVRTGKNMDLIGYSTSAKLLPHSRTMKFPSLSAQVDDWNRVLVSLATDFYEGSANVDPKKYPATCERCSQRILCRLDPTLLEEDENAPAEVTGG